jgi:hypothetical protein
MGSNGSHLTLAPLAERKLSPQVYAVLYDDGDRENMERHDQICGVCFCPDPRGVTESAKNAWRQVIGFFGMRACVLEFLEHLQMSDSFRGAA